MASSSPKEPLDELNNNTETEEGTIALQKKRSRRVSFAEITSVHVFDRDEYSDNTPPDLTKPITGDKPDDEVLGFFRDLIGTKNSNDVPNEEDDDDDDEVMDARKSFFRSIDSPSPGSTTGSATSNNDEDSFFGPVSASFIRPGMYSDSAASEDENHDLTMDSTAFSMHFRSLARSESEVELKMPTGVTELAFEQNTQTPKTPSDNHSLMTLTRDNKLILQSPASVAKFRHTMDSNEMSLVDENPHQYDYAKLPPGLESLLAESGHDLPSDAVLLRPLESPSYTNKEKGVFRVGIDSNDYMVDHYFHDRSAEAPPVAHVEVSDANHYSTVNPGDGVTRLSDDGALAERSYGNQPQSAILLSTGIPLDRDKEPIEVAFESSKLKEKPYDYDERHQSPAAALKASICTNQSHAYSPRKGMHNYETDGNCGHIYQSAMPGSVPYLSTKQRQLFFEPASSLRDTRNLTPYKWPGSYISQENIRHSKSMSSIQKSVSKLNILKNSPYISSTQDGHDISRRRLSLFPLTPSFDMHNKDAQIKHAEVPIVRLEEQFSEIDQKKGEVESATNMDSTRTTTSKNIGNFIQTEETSAKSNKLDFTEEILVTTGTGFSLAGTLLTHGENKKASGSPEFVSCQLERLSKSALSPEHKINNVMNLKPENETNKVVSALSEEDRDCLEAATSRSKISAKAHETDLEPSFNESISSQYLAQMDRAGLKRTSPQDLRVDAHASRNLDPSLRMIETLNFQLGTPGENDQIGTDFFTSRNPTKGEILSTHHPASPYVTQLSTNEPSVKEIQSPLRKSSRNRSRSDNVHPSVQNSSGRKRRRAELVPNDVIAKIQKSPKVKKSENNDTMSLLEHSNEINGGRVNIGDDLSLNHSSDIVSKFSAELESLHSFLADKLNPHVIGVLEDVLAHVQKVKKIERLCADVQCQKISEPSRDIRNKRASEMRSLVSRLIYERAKSQFLRMKRETLQKKVDVLRHATHESQSLKTIFKDLYVPNARDAQVGDKLRQSLTVDYGAKNVVFDKVATMKQEVEASERKIKHLTESFHTLLKVKGELSTSDTLVLVNDHLKKRTCCRLIRQDMLAWEVDDFESRNGQHDVVVNYHGFICQRFTLANPASGIVVSSILSEANIVKKFPNMEACTAFTFMLKAVNNRKYAAGKRSLAQDTQMTSSLLGNLLDVTEEIRRARLELFSLTETRFHSPSVGRLDLQLVFIDLKSGHRTILTLDMSCLDRGIYPSEILPSQIQAPDSNTHTSPSQTRLAEIKAATDGLRVGYVRILRLCRCVSQIVEASNR